MTPAAWWNRIGHPRLLVVGDLMLDRYTWGETERISPEAPVIVLREDLAEVRLGGAANVASFLRGLDADVVLAGVVGDDVEGRTLQRLLQELPVDATQVTVAEDRATTIKHRFVGRSAQRQPHQLLRVDRETRTAISTDLEARLCDGLSSILPTCDAVLVSDYGKGVCTPTLLQTVINAARKHQIPVLVDPSRDVDYQRYTGATLVAPNRVAAERVIGHALRDPTAIRQAAAQLRNNLQLDVAVLTLDRDGLAYATEHDAGLVPCRPREVCDVTGAGDMVLAMLGLCLAAHVPLIDSLHLANIAAGLEVERFGVEQVSRADIERELARGQTESREPVDLDQLVAHVAEHRRAGRTIVFTNGCFDLLHVGHVTLLEEAAQLGDVLIVAINSDASIRQLKGSDRPIIGQDDRARMLAALACVNHVLIFNDDTPHRLLHALRPDVLVKGGTTNHIVGREIVEAYGGRIMQTSAVNNVSTTALVTRVHQQPLATSGTLE